VEAGSGSNGTLYVVATPIGNLEDITLRAIRVLGEVALIAAEDTRQTRKLLNHLGLQTPLISYYRGKEAERAQVVLDRLAEGRNVALVSDAGTPGISDPGGLLVERAREKGIKVVPIPGPAAVSATVSVAGLKDAAFYFLGFPPSRKGERVKYLRTVATIPAPLVFYESPQRISQTLADCLEVFGERRVLVARELTKLYEETLVGELREVLANLKSRPRVKGELVVVLWPAKLAAAPAENEVEYTLINLRDQGLSVRDAVQQVLTEVKIPRSNLYKEALRIWDSQEKKP
jgi:16S rRNA (cytidine1402-2'-O)-methyltransferase